MSTASSKGGQNKRRAKRGRRYGKLRGVQIVDKQTAIPKAISAQRYLRGGMKAREEDPSLTNLVLKSSSRNQNQAVQVVTEEGSRRVGAIVASANAIINAVQVRMFWRRAINDRSSRVPDRELRLLRSRLERLTPDIASPQRTFESLLESLRFGLDDATNQAIDAVLEIQSTAIPAVNRKETVSLLVEFIKKHQRTNSQKVLIAVGAAIRKVLLNIADEQLALAAELMNSSGSLEVPIEVELEVAKMVVHRFRYAPNTSIAGLTGLAELLLENAKVYSRANLVNREYYGATALNSVLSIVLMRHKEASALTQHIESNSPRWFVDLVKSRLRRMAKEIENEKLVDSIALVDLMKVLGTKSANSSASHGDQ